MSVQDMVVVPVTALSNRSVLAPEFSGPAMKGDGPFSFRCATCKSTLLEGCHSVDQVQNLVVKCFDCGTYNAVPVAK
jgi:hypothetical protein